MIVLRRLMSDLHEIRWGHVLVERVPVEVSDFQDMQTADAATANPLARSWSS